jgi:hypothetical protein
LIAKLGNGPAIQAILAHNRGQTPRPFRSVVDEDAHPAAHTTDRHVFGMGRVHDIEKLALRACRHKPTACPGQAGAFDSLGSANASVAKVIRDHVNDNWEDVRQLIISGQGQLDLRSSLAGRGTALRKKDAPVNEKYPVTAIPKAYHEMGNGKRPLYPGDRRVTEHVSADEVETDNPMSEYVEVTEAYVRFVPDPGSPGGWYVNSAWPE